MILDTFKRLQTTKLIGKVSCSLLSQSDEVVEAQQQLILWYLVQVVSTVNPFHSPRTLHFVSSPAPVELAMRTEDEMICSIAFIRFFWGCCGWGWW